MKRPLYAPCTLAQQRNDRPAETSILIPLCLLLDTQVFRLEITNGSWEGKKLTGHTHHTVHCHALWPGSVYDTRVISKYHLKKEFPFDLYDF